MRRSGEVRCPIRLHHIAAPIRQGTIGEPQQEQKRGEPSMLVHYAEIGSTRLGSLFLTLPTRGPTGQHVIPSEG